MVEHWKNQRFEDHLCPRPQGTSPLNHLTQLIAQENFIILSHQESNKSHFIFFLFGDYFFSCIALGFAHKKGLQIFILQFCSHFFNCILSSTFPCIVPTIMILKLDLRNCEMNFTHISSNDNQKHMLTFKNTFRITHFIHKMPLV
jgi:hypothetical protein